MEIEELVVTAEQMRAIEGRIFEAGMPVAALMEKVAGLITRQLQDLLVQKTLNSSPSPLPTCGILVGPGHNGGDALVVARELHFQGFNVAIYCPFSKLKELTHHHAQYVRSLGISIHQEIAPFKSCDVLIDGLFGFGLEREITGEIAATINEINAWSKPIFSIDLPSGIHTDTGEVLGTAIRATHTFCLGLWKVAFLQDSALEYIGKATLIQFDIPLVDAIAILGESPTLKRITAKKAISNLPLPRAKTAHKYTNGHLLIVAGSHRYSGAAILSALGARASGIGMLSVAVPESIKPLLTAQLPEALIIGCPETAKGAICQFPATLDLHQYDTIACGPGFTQDPINIVETLLETPTPLILDADGLNILAQLGTIPTLAKRKASTLLTPHPGEFKRLFPELTRQLSNRILAVQEAAKQSQATILLKGARVAIANGAGEISLNPDSTPALARGGSGDVLTGLLGGLCAQATLQKIPLELAIETATWWHAQAGLFAAQERTELGVDAFTLTQALIPTLVALTH